MLQLSLKINRRMDFFDPYNIYTTLDAVSIFTTNCVTNQVFKVWEEYEQIINNIGFNL